MTPHHSAHDDAPDLSRARFLRQMIPMAVIAVAAWAAFAFLYATFYPVNAPPDAPLGVFWLWLAAGTGGFVLTTLLVLRLFKTPPEWRMHATVALTAPALICDVLTGTQPELWIPNGGAAADRLYLSLIVGGVGILQVLSLLTTTPKERSSPNTTPARSPSSTG